STNISLLLRIVYGQMKEENAKVIKEDTSDRISKLPECIIENILSRLDDPKARVRVSVLSKIWFALTASLPVLEFSSRDFWKDDRNKFWRSDDREIFYKYVVLGLILNE
ncbi:F-box domain containing protein, partial [Tanacetum coccineum]